MAFEAVEDETELKFKAAIIELEGVIAETGPYEVQAWKNTAGEHGVFADDWKERWKRLGDDGLMEWILEKGHLPESGEEILVKKEAYYSESMKRLSPKDLSPGIAPLLKNLKKNGVRIAAASTRKNAEAALEKLEIGDFFDEVIHEVTVAHEQSLIEQVLTAAKALDISYEKSVVMVDVKKLNPEKHKELFVIGVGSSEPVEGSDWTVASTGELTYENLKEKFLKDR